MISFYFIFLNFVLFILIKEVTFLVTRVYHKELFMSDFWLYLTCCLMYCFYYKTFQHNLLTKSNGNFILIYFKSCTWSLLNVSMSKICSNSFILFWSLLQTWVETARQLKGKKEMFLLMWTVSFIWSPVAFTCWETFTSMVTRYPLWLKVTSNLFYISWFTPFYWIGSRHPTVFSNTWELPSV